MTDQQKLIDHVKEEITGKACPICGNQEWNIGEDLAVLEMKDGQETEVACAVCTHCGFMPLFSEV